MSACSVSRTRSVESWSRLIVRSPVSSTPPEGLIIAAFIHPLSRFGRVNFQPTYFASNTRMRSSGVALLTIPPCQQNAGLSRFLFVGAPTLTQGIIRHAEHAGHPDYRRGSDRRATGGDCRLFRRHRTR